MYDFLRGTLIEHAPEKIVLEVGGIGYEVIIPGYTSESFSRTGTEIFIWTHLQVKEDGITLFGFSSKSERQLFRILIKVSGVGPRMAMQILSGIQPEELIKALTEENWKRLTLISGIGPKTARRLLIELKEKLTDRELLILPSSDRPVDPVLMQAFNALETLGFSTEAIRDALQDVSVAESGKSTSEKLEIIVKNALTKLA